MVRKSVWVGEGRRGKERKGTRERTDPDAPGCGEEIQRLVLIGLAEGAAEVDVVDWARTGCGKDECALEGRWVVYLDGLVGVVCAHRPGLVSKLALSLVVHVLLVFTI